MSFNLAARETLSKNLLTLWMIPITSPCLLKIGDPLDPGAAGIVVIMLIPLFPEKKPSNNKTIFGAQTPVGAAAL